MANIKKKAPKKTNGSAVMKDIQALHTCISKDQNQLEKLYRKTLINTNKKLLATKKLLAKTKEHVRKTKSAKANKPKAYQSTLSELQSLQKQFEGLKAELAFIETGYTQFNAQQKVLFKFAKEWNNKKTTIKRKPNKTNKALAETAGPEVAPGPV